MQKGNYVYKVSYQPLWNLLMRRGIDRVTFAQSVGVSVDTINDMRKGAYIDMPVVVRICAELDCDIKDVMSISKADAPGKP